jgi:hypothetical protein
MGTAMPKSNGIRFLGDSFRQGLLLRALPRLGEFSPGERDAALARARETRFDLIEWIGVLAGVMFVTWLLRFEQHQIAAFSLPVLYFAQFVTAAPLLLLVVGPFYWRCTLRGLDEEVERRRQADSSRKRS